MKVNCPISGISYVLTSPVRGHAIHPHPMLSSDIKCAQLADWYLADWTKGDLPPIETHLLGVAYLLKLPIESIGIVTMTDMTLPVFDKFWSGIMEKLAKLALRLEGKNSKFKRLPKMVVTADTIQFVPDWLDLLAQELGNAGMPISEKAKELNRESYKVDSSVTGRTISQYLDAEQIDTLVLRALRNSPLASSEQKALPVILADWAIKVADFPEHSRVRWHRIIQTIFAHDYIDRILMSDIKLEQIKDLEEHMRLNTPVSAVGTSHSTLLMERFNTVIPVISDFSPAISGRKKMDEGLLSAALMGEDGKPVPRLASNAPKGLTLAERLAARMNKMGSN